VTSIHCNEVLYGLSSFGPSFFSIISSNLFLAILRSFKAIRFIFNVPLARFFFLVVGIENPEF
jgi:hypothetical protein